MDATQALPNCHITLKGALRKVVYSFRSINLLEQTTGKNLFEGAAFDLSVPEQLRIVLWAGLVTESPYLSLSEISLKDFNHQVARRVVVDALRASHPVLAQSENRENQTDKPFSWLLLLSRSVVMFGVSEEQFWKLTPAQFLAYSERYREKQEEKLNYLAEVLAAIANGPLKKLGGGKITASDFIARGKSDDSPALDMRRQWDRFVKQHNKQVH